MGQKLVRGLIIVSLSIILVVTAVLLLDAYVTARNARQIETLEELEQRY